MQTITHKRGDTFSFGAAYYDNAGAPVNLTVAGVIPYSQVRTADEALLANLDIDVLDQNTRPGEYTLFTNNTEWPVETVYWDIEYRRAVDDVIVSTETIAIDVQFDVTRVGTA